MKRNDFLAEYLGALGAVEIDYLAILKKYRNFVGICLKIECLERRYYSLQNYSKMRIS